MVDKRFCSRNALRFQAYPEAMKEQPSRCWLSAKVSFDIRFLVPCGWHEFNRWLHACKTCKLKRFSARPGEKRPLNAWHNCRESRADVIAQASVFIKRAPPPIRRRAAAQIGIKTQLFTKFRGTFIELLSKRPFLSSKTTLVFKSDVRVKHSQPRSRI